MRGSAARCLVAAAVFALPVLGDTGPAIAQAIDLTCPGAANVLFSPGLTPIPQLQTVSGEVRGGSALSAATPCLSMGGTPYSGAIGQLSGSGVVGCIGGAAGGTIDITWNNGDTSIITWRLAAIPPVPILDARVTSGALAGATVLLAGIPTAFTGLCGLNPVTSVSGVGVAEFIRL